MAISHYAGRYLGLLSLMALIAASLFITVVPAAGVNGPCIGASDWTDYGTYYVVEGTKGDDAIDCGGSDKPVDLRGNRGNDLLLGTEYGDWIRGGWGDDVLFGFGGDDYLYGGWGDDSMTGGANYDVCEGGRGWDGFTSECEVQDYGLEP